MITVGIGAGIGFQNNPIQPPPLTLPQFRAPTLVSAPVVSGSGDVGQALSVTPAVWDAHPVPIITGQWLLDGADIGGETRLSYTPVAGQEGMVLSYREIAENGVGTANAVSNGVGVSAANSAPFGADVTLQFDVLAA